MKRQRDSILLNLFWLVLIANACKKQEAGSSSSFFVKLFPEDTSYQAGGAFELPDGSFIEYGFTPEDINVRPLIIKTDANGNITGKKYLPFFFHYCTIHPTDWGTMIAVGIDHEDATSVHVCELDNDGEIIDGTIGDYFVGSIKSGALLAPRFVINGDGDLIITGTSIAGGTILPFVLQVYAGGGNAQPQVFDPGGGDLMAKGICITADGGYMIVGSSYFVPPRDTFNVKSFCLKLDGSCNELWDTIVSYTESSVSATSVAGMGSTDFVFTGSILTNGVWQNSNISDLEGILYAQKIDDTGKLGDTTIYSHYQNLAHVGDLVPTSDGGYILTATTNELLDGHLISNYHIYLLKLYASLKEEWHTEINASSAYTAVSVTKTLDGGYLISGYEHSGTYHYTMSLIKTDAMGNVEK